MNNTNESDSPPVDHLTARKRMVSQAKYQAKRLKVPFSLAAEDIVIPERCPVTGVELRQASGRRDLCSPTLTREVPNLGYVPSNISVMSYLAACSRAGKHSADLRKARREQLKAA